MMTKSEWIAGGLAVALLVGVFSSLFLPGCSDADNARREAYNEDMRVTLWSGGQPVKEWISKGHVAHDTSSSLLYFKDKQTGLFVRIRGNISIEQIGAEAEE